MVKAIYKKINIDFATDFEARIRKLAEIIRNSPTNDTDEFIRHLSLEEWAKELKESVEYFKVILQLGISFCGCSAMETLRMCIFCI